MQPVIIFTYNKPDHLFKSIKSLKKNNSFPKTKFFIIQDKLKNFGSIILDKYKQLYKKLPSNIKVIKRTYNYGLKKNIIEGVSLILKKYKKVIVCEDDLIFDKDFLNFRSNKYKKILFKRKKLQYSFNYDDAQSHTLWPKKNSLKKISSWNIEWEFYNFIRKYYTLYPKKTYVEKRGFDGSGVHCTKADYKFQLIDHNFKFKKNKIKIDKISENLLFRSAIKKNIQDNFFKKIVYYNYI